MHAQVLTALTSYVFKLLSILLSFNSTHIVSCKYIYDRHTLLQFRAAITRSRVSHGTDPPHGFSAGIESWINAVVVPARRRRRKNRRGRYRGRRAGILVRARSRADRLPLPSILFANVQSLDNKMTELRARNAVSGRNQEHWKHLPDRIVAGRYGS